MTAHVHGDLVVHDDETWVRGLVERLTTRHEAGRERPWATGDAPQRFITGQLWAIVGVEVRITRVEGKAKLSQNRPPADVDGVVAAGGPAPDRPDRAESSSWPVLRPSPRRLRSSTAPCSTQR